jgi:hypothetical protein
VTHQFQIRRGSHTYVYRFATWQVGFLRCWLWIQADRGVLTYDEVFEANDYLRTLTEGPTDMTDSEGLRQQFVREGYYPTLSGNDDGWQCLLMHSHAKPHRPPFGKGETALQAMIAANCDRVEMLRAKAAV